MGSDIRIKSALKVRIGEAKSLPSKSCRILPGCPNTFCVINLDKEQLFETEIVHRTPCPFFCEQFEFEIPRAFWTVGFYLVTTDTTLSITNKSTIGKVTFTKEQLCRIPNKDQWYGLKSIKCDTEAQGKANIAMCISTNADDVITLQVRLKACANLYMSDLQKIQPFAVIEIIGPNNSIRSKTQQTKILRSSSNMQWKNQIYQFKLNDLLKKCDNDLSKLSLKADFYHHNGVLREGTFLGQVVADLCNVSEEWSNLWYFLCPKLSDAIIQPNHDLGSLRLKIEYQEDHILPSKHYKPLLDLLVNCLDQPQEDIETNPISLASCIFNEHLINLAQCLVRVFLHLEKIEELLLSLTKLDMSKTSNPNTLFRANSLATKGIDELMKIVGRPYLRRVLKPGLDKIHRENLPCEIDPSRLRAGMSLENNLANLTQNIDCVYSAIVNSGYDCPYTLSSLFDKLQTQAMETFPDVADIQYTAVSGFIFLRLFAPAILNPKLFQLQSRRPSLDTSRTLTLVSKVIQSLGNLDTHQAGKEKYMQAISKRVLDVQHVNGVKQFLEDICKTNSKSRENQEKLVHSKEGKLLEYRVNNMIGRDFSKRRKFYKLSDKGLTCIRCEASSDSYMIKKSDIRRVSRVDEDACGVPHIFQVIHNQGTLYLRANNSVDHSDWIACIDRLCKYNPDKIYTYHTGIMLHGRWTCCSNKRSHTHEEGCYSVPRDTDNIPDIDIYRELQRLYQIMNEGFQKLIAYRTTLQSQLGSSPESLVHWDHISKSILSVEKLINVVQEIREAHEKYASEQTIISPGTRHVPLCPVPVG